MKKVFLPLFAAAIPLFAQAGGAALVYDPTNHTEGVILRNQTIANTSNLLAALELQRKWLEAIQEQNIKLKNEANEIKNKTETLKNETEIVRKNVMEQVRVLGDPAKLDVKLTDIPQVTPAQNRTLQELKKAAMAESNQIDEELFGADANPETKTAMLGAAYRNYAQVVEATAPLKERLILRREALKDAIHKTNTISGQLKMQTALLAINGQLDDIEREEVAAHNKMSAIEMRNKAAEEQLAQRRQAETIDTWSKMEAMSYDPKFRENAEREAGVMTAEEIDKLGTTGNGLPGNQTLTTTLPKENVQK